MGNRLIFLFQQMADLTFSVPTSHPISVQEY